MDVCPPTHRLTAYLVGRVQAQREAEAAAAQHWTRTLPSNVTLDEHVPPTKRERKLLMWQEENAVNEEDGHFAEYQRETAEEGEANTSSR